MYSFGYDDTGRLITITDVDSLQTKILRDSLGNPTQIIAPFGQTIKCSVDSIGYLNSVRNEAGEVTTMTSTIGGLLKTFCDPKGGLHKFTYNNVEGRLIKDEDPDGGYKVLTRWDFDNGITSGYVVGFGLYQDTRGSFYHVETIPETGGTHYTIRDGNGADAHIYMNPGCRREVKPDGTQIVTTFKPDPRYGLLAPLLDVEITSPSGIVNTIKQNRTITELTGTTVTGLVDSIVINDKIYKTIYDGHQHLFTSISPEGRTSYSWINDKGRIVKDSIAGVDAVNYTYNPQGFMTQVSQSERTSTFGYDTKGWLASITDPIGRSVLFDVDSVGRIVNQMPPDNNNIRYSYDANSNVTSITPPGRPAHTFDYTRTDLVKQYLPPILATDTMATKYDYDLDQMLLDITRPDNHKIVFNYDTTTFDDVCWGGCFWHRRSRVDSISFDQGILSFNYDWWSGALTSVISPSNDTLLYSYDGELPTRVDMRGVINGSVSVHYDNNFRVVSQTINDVDSIQYTYDNDGLLTQLGDLQITRDSSNGRVMSTQVGNVTTDYAYSNTGELASVDNSVNGSSIYSTNYLRDSLGRITTLTETIEGTTTTKRYTYDVAGRLSAVYQNDLLTAKYYYDANGNRDSVVTPSGTTRGVYDAQDRMLQYGNARYIYTRNGELNLKIVGADTTKYVYDDFGNLMSVTLPNQTKIEYIIDGQNRRVGRKLNGVVTNRWLYAGQLHPVAEVDSTGNIIATYHGSFMKRGDSLYTIIRDHLGSVRMVMNAQTGEVVQRMDYDEYGNVSFDSNTGFQPFGYAGGLYDAQTRLNRIGVRDYDSNTGRWERKDQILFFDEQNIYMYVCDEPINRIDVYGLYWEYSQGSGNMTHVDDKTGARTFLGTGHAGHGKGLNKPSMENVKNTGPLPKGCYAIGDQGDYTTKAGDLLEEAMVLTPDKGNVMYDRGGFLIHGGSYSKGCIILDLNFRDTIAQSGDDLLVVVK